MSKVTQVIKVYCVFKHVWTDSDDDVKEYEILEVFKNAEEATTFIKMYNLIRKPHPFYGTLEIEPLLLTKGISPYHLQWNEKFKSWSISNDRTFKSAQPKAVMYFLEKYKSEELTRVSIDGCKPYSSL